MVIQTSGTSTSQYEMAPCPPNCELCRCGAGHVSVRLKSSGEKSSTPDSASEAATILGRTSPVGYQEPVIGTHIREALDIISDWWRSSHPNV